MECFVPGSVSSFGCSDLVLVSSPKSGIWRDWVHGGARKK